jgi:hypothetical protein
MPSLSQSASSQTQLAASLEAGVRSLSLDEKIGFSQYNRSVLPTDGYVFYVNTGQTVTIPGSLHYSVNREQNEDETNDLTRIVFTALERVDVFNAVSPDTLFVGTFDGIKFAFSGRGPFYQQAGLYHYVGVQVSPALASQLVDGVGDLPAGPIVSNSLPIWLAQTTIGPVYPSFLVPANVVPPYVAVQVEPRMTEAAHFPIYQWPGTTQLGTGDSPLHSMPSYQLSQDHVRLTLYGFTNQQAIQYIWTLMDHSLLTDDFGFANTPTIQDDKRAQASLGVLAMKKTIDIVAWYYQTTADAVARRLILSANLSSITVQ